MPGGCRAGVMHARQALYQLSLISTPPTHTHTQTKWIKEKDDREPRDLLLALELSHWATLDKPLTVLSPSLLPLIESLKMPALNPRLGCLPPRALPSVGVLQGSSLHLRGQSPRLVLTGLSYPRHMAHTPVSCFSLLLLTSCYLYKGDLSLGTILL